jgi:hypothetical protein
MTTECSEADKKATGETKGLSPKLERAISLVAAGMAQKDAAAAAGIRPDYLCRMINSERGQERHRYWLAREVALLAPKAIRSLDKAMEGPNAAAAVKAAEGILDRSGLHRDDMRQQISFQGEGLTVHFDIAPRSPQE